MNQRDNGFVNRRSSVQSGQSAQKQKRLTAARLGRAIAAVLQSADRIAARLAAVS